jgi:hypothetical protein
LMVFMSPDPAANMSCVILSEVESELLMFVWANETTQLASSKAMIVFTFFER